MSISKSPNINIINNYKGVALPEFHNPDSLKYAKRNKLRNFSYQFISVLPNYIFVRSDKHKIMCLESKLQQLSPKNESHKKEIHVITSLIEILKDGKEDSLGVYIKQNEKKYGTLKHILDPKEQRYVFMDTYLSDNFLSMSCKAKLEQLMEDLSICEFDLVSYKFVLGRLGRNNKERLFITSSILFIENTIILIKRQIELFTLVNMAETKEIIQKVEDEDDITVGIDFHGSNFKKRKII